KAGEVRQPALARTDLCNRFGFVKFCRAAQGKGVKPIAGADVWLENECDRDKSQRILLLARSHAGYLASCDLLTRAWLNNQHRGRAEIRRDWLAEHEGLIVLSGGRHGDVGQMLEAGRDDEALRSEEHTSELQSRENLVCRL